MVVGGGGRWWWWLWYMSTRLMSGGGEDGLCIRPPFFLPFTPSLENQWRMDVNMFTQKHDRKMCVFLWPPLLKIFVSAETGLFVPAETCFCLWPPPQKIFCSAETFFPAETCFSVVNPLRK